MFEINVLDTKFHGKRTCNFWGAIAGMIGGMIANTAGGAAAKSETRKGLSEAGDQYDYSADLIAKELQRTFTQQKRRTLSEYKDALREFRPYSKMGTKLLARYKQTLKPGSQWYQWRKDEGEKDVRRWLASEGMSGSGEAAVEAFQRMNTQLSAEEEQDLYNRLLGGVNIGYESAGSRSALRTKKADSLIGIYGDRAVNTSSLYSWLAEAKAKLEEQRGEANAGFYKGLGQMGGQAGTTVGGMFK